MKQFLSINKLIKVCFTGLLLVIVLSCTKAQLSSSNSMNILGHTDYYLLDGMETRIYWNNSDFGTFITQLAPTDGKLILPKSMLIGDYGSRVDPNEAVDLKLVAKVLYENHPSGDFYFESPVLGPELTVSNVTTALSWFLKYSFSTEKLKISKKSFDQIVMNIEVKCSDCRKKTNSQILNQLLSDSHFIDKTKQILQGENPQLDISTEYNWSPPRGVLAWSDPNLTLNGVGSKEAQELKTVLMSCYFINPVNSTQKILPDHWIHDFNSNQTITKAEDKLTYIFSYDEQGSHLFMPVFSELNISGELKIIFSISDVNRKPVCDSPIKLTMRSNVKNTVSLSPYCRDFDLNNSSLTYSLNSGPNGLVISSQGNMIWTPPSGTNSAQVNFNITDSQMGMTNETISIDVGPDQAPTFTTISSNYSFSEGTEGSFSISASDIDRDPLELSIEAIDSVKTGFPDGAGAITQITRTGSEGNYTFDVKFTPSYLQAIGSNGIVRLKFFLHYESLGGSYDSSLRFDERIVEYLITNVDDPPSWDIQPGDINATEGLDLGGINVGRASDASINSTSITYSLIYSGSANCIFTSLSVAKDGSDNVLLSGYPDYFSNEDCMVAIRVADSNNLISDSQYFKMTIANTNQPITLLGAPLSVVNGDEGKILSLSLENMFDEPDLNLTPVDLRESLSFDCKVDTNLDTVYETNCLDLNMNFGFSPGSLASSWTPPALSEGTYKIKLSVTDIGGVTATNYFDLVIAPSATPMVLSTLFQSQVTTDFQVNEVVPSPLTLRASAASVRPIDNYDFVVSTPTCSVIGASGNCSVGLIVTPGAMGGNGTSDLIFTINPSFTDGNAVFPNSSKRYAISFYLQKQDDATVYSQHNIFMTVNNTNRAPTAITVTKGSFGCTGSSSNSSTTAFTVCIDASKDSKVGNSWSKTYAVPLNYVDADGLNDSYSYEFQGDLTPGNIGDNSWNFKLPNCVNSSTGTFTRSYNLELSDGRGGIVIREIILKVVKASASASCL